MKNKQASHCLEMLKNSLVSDALPANKIDNEKKRKSLPVTYSLLSADHQRGFSCVFGLVVWS